MSRTLRLGVTSDGDVLEVDPGIMLDGCLIVGAEGSGKTTLARHLIEEHLRLGFPTLAIDTTGDLTARLEADLGLSISRDLALMDGSAAIRLRNVDIDDVAELFELPMIAELPRLVSALLGVLQYRVRRATPEYALIETIVHEAWETGRGLSLRGLAELIANPPMRRLGMFELDDVISPDRRSSLSAAVLNLLDTTEAWGDGPSRAPSLRDLLSSSGDAAATVLTFGQQSLRARRFIIEVLLAMIEYDNPQMMLIMDEPAAFIPPLERTPVSSMLLEALSGGTDFTGVRVVLVAEEPADLSEFVEDLCETWIVSRMPAPRSRRQVVEALDLVSPPVDEVALDRTLSRLPRGTYVLRSSRLNSLHEFRIPSQGD